MIGVGKQGLRELVRLIYETQVLDEELVEIINAWVRDPRSVDKRARSTLQSFVGRQTLPQTTRLERIERLDPGWDVGSSVELDLKSFSTLRFSEDQRSDNIAWKTSDKAIVTIEEATRGWPVDYDIVHAMFSASSEHEVLVTGRYACARIERILEPGTYPQYGYRVPMYVLKER